MVSRAFAAMWLNSQKEDGVVGLGDKSSNGEKVHRRGLWLRRRAINGSTFLKVAYSASVVRVISTGVDCALSLVW